MLSGLYSYVFGAENEAQESSSTGPCMRTRTNEDDGWLLVQECESGRSSPILIASPELIEIDGLSCISVRQRAPSPSVVRRAEVLREARVANRLRANLEKAMFSDAEPADRLAAAVEMKGPVGKVSAAKLKRASTSSIVAAESKIKNRSKKAGKLLSGANNNRKCNNLA